MTRFTHGDPVIIKGGAAHNVPEGTRAHVIAVFERREDRPGSAFDHFPDGPVYTVELFDASTREIHESFLEPFN